jgi:hypothetical protein
MNPDYDLLLKKTNDRCINISEYAQERRSEIRTVQDCERSTKLKEAGEKILTLMVRSVLLLCLVTELQRLQS